MITIDVAEYCSACMDFDPDVQRPQKAYGMSEEIVISEYKDHADYIKLHNNTRSIVEEILEMIRTKLTEVENAEN